jgi:uncharacterized protein DUF4124
MSRLALRPLLPLVLATALGIGPVSAFAQIYRWTDTEGEVHYSEGVESVPARYRRDAVIIGHEPSSSPPVAQGTPSRPVAPPRGTGKVTFTPKQAIIVTARVNDTASARLMLDMETAHTIINPGALREGVQLVYLGSWRITTKGITGGEALTVGIESLDVGGARYGPLMVVSQNPGFERDRADGILGRDFLDHFTVSIDEEAGTVTLTPK